MINATVLGTGSYLPGEAVSNEDLASAFGREILWLAEMLGARSRHLAIDLRTRELRKGQSNAAMAAAAARHALNDADVDPRSIDLVIMATCTPDYAFPATVLFVQEMLDLPPCCTLELRAGCGGVAHAFMIARSMIATGAIKHALLIGSDLTSPYIALQKQDSHSEKDFLVSAAMFGDGAGALVLGASDGVPGVLDARSWSMSTGRPAAMVLRTGGALDMSRAADSRDPAEKIFLHDYKSILEVGPALIRAACDWLQGERGIDFHTIDYFVPPQVSGNLVGIVAGELGVPASKIVTDFARVGNTVSASIYLALDQIHRSGILTRGDNLVLLPAEATKWVYGAVVLRWGRAAG
jgi:3-oxoacyl-[acyl-carrier-protein] synthase-3